jgi:hypothetical protein
MPMQWKAMRVAPQLEICFSGCQKGSLTVGGASSVVTAALQHRLNLNVLQVDRRCREQGRRTRQECEAQCRMCLSMGTQM